MCYFLYGNIDETAYDEDFFKVCDKFTINHDKLSIYDIDLKSKIPIKGIFFRLTDTNNHCDCGTSIGGSDENNKELINYLNWLKSLKKCKSINNICIIKRWSDDVIKQNVKIHIDKIDCKYLANIKENTIYNIQLFWKKHY